MRGHEAYMRRGIQLAKNGLGTTYPNPMVGSVIVHDHRIIGEGWHARAGGPHAEVMAIRSVKNPELLKEATIYVTLEPCSHFGKTPPCSDLIIRSGIPKVIIGTVDPYAKVSGRGINKLLKAGCDLVTGVLASECERLNKRFFTYHTQKRPYIILKWAESHDGFVSPNPETRKQQHPEWITNTLSRQLVHQWRAQETAILVGTNTVMADNPILNTRDWKGANPWRIVIDRTQKIPTSAAIFGSESRTLVMVAKGARPEKTVPENIAYQEIDFEANVPGQILEVLYAQELHSLIIEGGAHTLQSFINANLWDEARVFVGGMGLGSGIKAPQLPKKCPYTVRNLNGDLLNNYHND